MWCSVADFLVLAAAFNVVATHAGGTDSSPREKVIDLLEELRSEVSAEGEAEAKTYNTFACFCKDTMAEKSQAISDGEGEKTTLQATLNGAMVARDTEDASIASKTKEIVKEEKELEKLHEQRHKEALKYDKEEVDLTGAVQALEGAIQELKASKTAVGFVQLARGSAPAKALDKAAIAVEALLGRKSTVTATAATSASAVFTQLRSSAVPSQQYAFHADNVISTLEGLLTDFKDAKTTLDTTETNARNTYNLDVQTKENAIKAAEKAITGHKSKRAEEVSKIATASKDLSVVSAQVLDDQQYLTELSGKCNEKANLWDERTAVRANELTALSSALKIVKEMPVANTTFLVQRKASDVVAMLAKGAQSPAVETPRSLSVKAEQVVHQQAKMVSPPALVQLQRRQRSRRLRHTGSRASNSAQQAAQVLQEVGTKLQNKELLTLALHVTEDPFAKVKVMIQELIERLLKQAQEEANHKGWCDEQVGLAKQKRNTAAEDIVDVNDRLASGEARIQKLDMEVKELDKELLRLDGILTKAKTNRQDEKAENAAALKLAKDGLDAVNQAIDIIDKFYKTAAKNPEAAAGPAAAFLQVAGAPAPATKRTAGPIEQPDIPDAGFDDSYTGNQGGATGVLGMLDVVKSDMERDIAETENAEEEAEQAYLELETQTGKSVAEKSEILKSQEFSLNDANATDTEDREKLSSLQALMDAGLAELEALAPACMGGGMTAEEKRIKREEEIQALNQALCILENHGLDAIDSC